MVRRVLIGALLAAVSWPPPAVSAGSTTELGCEGSIVPEPDFAEALTLSGPMAAAFMPSVASLGDRVLIAWQETDTTENRVAYAIAAGGCLGPTRYVADPLPNARRPSVAATADGWVLAYEAQRIPSPLVRSVRLDSEGTVVSGPETISAAGAVASRVRVAARGDDVVYAWTDVLGHYVARTGPIERLPPTPVGVRLEAAGLVNFPRVAVDGEGTIYLAYRDGGPERTDYEIRLVVRRPGEPFSAPINVSRSKGLMSDDVAIALEPDGRLRLVWVEQDADRPQAFEVVHAAVDRQLGISEPRRLGSLGSASFKPALVGGPKVVWQVGTARSGRLFFADANSGPIEIQPGTIGGMASLTDDADGDLHLAFVDVQDPPRLRYTARAPR